jgi:hypothetical protein
VTDFDAILAKLDEGYEQWKTGEKQKNEYKDKFFQAITEEMAQSVLAEDLAVVAAHTEEDARARLARYYPRHVVEAVRPADEGFYEAIIVENPAFLPHAVTFEGLVFERQIVSGALLLDDERLKEEDPELWEKVTYVPEPKRTLRPLDQLDAQLVAELQEYMYEGPPTVKLPAPKKIKEEDQ